jgi:hypothetical protein
MFVLTLLRAMIPTRESLKLSAVTFVAILFWLIPFVLIGIGACVADQQAGVPAAVATVRCYSAAEPIVTSRALNLWMSGDTYLWVDSASGQRMRATGDCLITYDRR